MRVIQKFFIASLLMWIAPIAILYGFNHNLLPGKILKCLSLQGFAYWNSFEVDVGLQIVI